LFGSIAIAGGALYCAILPLSVARSSRHGSTRYGKLNPPHLNLIQPRKSC